MKKCTRCHSPAINMNMEGRIPGRNDNLCDVCYWRAEAERLTQALQWYLNASELMMLDYGSLPAREALKGELYLPKSC